MAVRQTKLLVPPATGTTYVIRRRLDARLQDALRSAVTIVCAGGGYGKTTLLQSWATQAAQDCAVAWLSLDPADTGAVPLFEALNASLARALNGVGGAVSRLLERGEERIQQLAAVLSNEVLAWTEEHERDVLLFVDDVQFVADDPSTSSALGEFVSGLPPRAHVVFATRTPLKFAPLAKLRAGGVLVEVTQNDLRFTQDEASELIAGDILNSYYQKTDGWPIVVGLLAQMHRRDPARPEMAISGTQDSIFQFLAEEVVGRLPDDVLQILYALALPETVESSIACGLLNVERIEPVIAQLQERGLSFTRDGADTWRLHALFREYLIQRFAHEDPEGLRALRIRYAELLREAGRTMEALAQILDAGDFENILNYVFEAIVTIRLSDRNRQVIRLLSRVPDEVFIERPMLHRFLATAFMRDKQVGAAQTQLRLCYERASASNQPNVAFFAQMDLGMSHPEFNSLLRRDHLRSEAHFRAALQLAESSDLSNEQRYRMLAVWQLGMVEACRGNLEAAFELLSAAERIEREQSRHYEMVLVEIATVHSWSGNWRRSLEYAELAEQLFRGSEGSVQAGRALVAQARALQALGTNATRAFTVAQAAIEELREANQDYELPLALAVRATAALHLQTPDIESARESIREGAEWLVRRPNAGYAFELELARFHLSRIVSDSEGLREHASSLRKLALANDDSWQVAMAYLCEAQRLALLPDRAAARDTLAVAQYRFEAVRDAYHSALCQMLRLAIGAQMQELDVSSIVALVEQQQSRSAEFVFRAVPQSTLHLLVATIRANDPNENAVMLLSEHAAADIEPLAAIIVDTSLTDYQHVLALRSAVRIDALNARPLVVRALDSSSAVISTAARTLMTFLPSAAAQPLRVDVIGTLRVHLGTEIIEENSERWGRKRSIELLRLLAVSDAPITKDAAIEALWPENREILDTTFRVTVHGLRRTLQPEQEGPGDYIVYDGTVLRIKPETFIGTDARVATDLLNESEVHFAGGRFTEAARAADAAIEIFGRSPREESVDEWLRPHVRRWRDRCVRALRLRAEVDAGLGDRLAAASYLERAFTVDPLNEELLVELIDASVAAGRVEMARTHFKTYRRRLEEQVGSTPGPAAMERYSRLLLKSSAAKSPLSVREHEIVSLIGRGLSNKEIASNLGLSVWTVNNHVAKVLKKLNVQSRTAAVMAAKQVADD